MTFSSVKSLVKNINGKSPGKTAVKKSFVPFITLWAYLVGLKSMRSIITTIKKDNIKETNEKSSFFVLLFNVSVVLLFIYEVYAFVGGKMMDESLDMDRQLESDRKKLFFFRLIVSCVCLAVAFSLYFSGLINFAGVMLIIMGALWNFFVDINSLWAFLLSLGVGAIYSMFAVIEGLYINAILYMFFYIPLQFYIWIRYAGRKDMSIKRNRGLSPSQVYYYVIGFILVCACTFAISLNFETQTLNLFDAVSACLLGTCACLQTFMYREYYFVRPVALIVALELWIFAIVENGLSMGAVAMLVLYTMYLIIDAYTMYFWLGLTKRKEKQKLGNIVEEGVLLQKLEEYNNLTNETHDDEKGGKIVS